MKSQFTIGAFGIIFDNNKHVLLCHRRDQDLWNLPGGVMESKESPWEAVIREVKEETGLEVEVVRTIGVYSKPQKDDLVFSFLCKKIGGGLMLNEEADKLQYFDTKHLPENTVPKQVERIHDAVQNRDELILKIQKENL